MWTNTCNKIRAVGLLGARWGDKRTAPVGVRRSWGQRRDGGESGTARLCLADAPREARGSHGSQLSIVLFHFQRFSSSSITSRASTRLLPACLSCVYWVLGCCAGYCFLGSYSFPRAFVPSKSCELDVPVVKSCESFNLGFWCYSWSVCF
jgi:hypothetical protein